MSIKKHIKERPELSSIQVYIDADIAEKLRTKLKREKIKIREFVEAAAKMYLAEK